MSRLAVIMAGGTGGHVFPALALADELSRRGWRIHWLGGSRGIETRAVPAAGYPMDILGTDSIRGRGPVGRVLGLLKVVRAGVKALLLLRQLKPALVVSLGGYTAGPGGVAAKVLGVPLVLHEQNAVAGVTNRLLSKIARGQAQAFDGALACARVTGNPVRQSIQAIADPVTRDAGRHRPARVLIFGGSQGAQALNEQVPGALASVGMALEIRHQAGRGKDQPTRAAYASAGIEASVSEFIDDMADAYAWADLVIGRAGALTVSELACAGVAAILVPLPSAVDDHQTQNARWLARAGAADVLPQSELSTRLGGMLKHWLGDAELMAQAASRGRAMAQPQATDLLADLCEDCAL
ncbi:undecaprenyldiphospho-muramoylpentapeptide beta-N-acetylglucosaminyltransferase [Litorivicinus lipolyticus]|uniref:UDP-N-acetylglucosamine--N-acetylmuramyl-(pentapeptide) pyrophosphoryl-undecaprenol N-acetylglucosamine transferase n=1 Tax=Litorivicinus lipolyticus TaxID=418701 RepID=A0A5Q2QCT9_9GAMM|nr:undecaprenyldiphospho-muramoylpentapeptide beta-N-acetylglucosaminyltransferase [Litorivicinus lipolyticus]QGG80944.1 undecaprenyldiphospho-muramoylpentapeptide beta-N-acetylglucosaminyltransferase [Litorivicinus lipolyticus]